MKYLNNAAVLAVDQDSIAAKRIVNAGNQQVFAKIEPNGDAIVGLFNTGEKAERISIQASAAGLPGNPRGYSLNSLWTGKTKKTAGAISATVPSHGVVLYRVAVFEVRRQDALRPERPRQGLGMKQFLHEAILGSAAESPPTGRGAVADSGMQALSFDVLCCLVRARTAWPSGPCARANPR